MARIKRIESGMDWPPGDRARHQAIRERFQRERPAPEEVVGSEEYEEPIPLGAYFSIRQAVGRLRELRAEAGLSLAQVARRCGIDKAALSRLENGKQLNPTLETLWRYAEGIGLEIEWRFVPRQEREKKDGRARRKKRE